MMRPRGEDWTDFSYYYCFFLAAATLISCVLLTCPWKCHELLDVVGIVRHSGTMGQMIHLLGFAVETVLSFSNHSGSSGLIGC